MAAFGVGVDFNRLTAPCGANLEVGTVIGEGVGFFVDKLD
jgi:hypothetical protein